MSEKKKYHHQKAAFRIGKMYMPAFCSYYASHGAANNPETTRQSEPDDITLKELFILERRMKIRQQFNLF